MKNNIAVIRKRKGINQKELAALVGITVSSLNKIERDKRNPTVGLLENIADKLEVSIKDIFLD